MKLSNPFARRLSLRIWLTVVVGMAVLTLAVGWAWRVAVEENSLNQPTAPGREMVLRGPDGQAVVRHLVAQRFKDLTPLLGRMAQALQGSRDFH